jgi:hypothetical protein
MNDYYLLEDYAHSSPRSYLFTIPTDQDTYLILPPNLSFEAIFGNYGNLFV